MARRLMNRSQRMSPKLLLAFFTITLGTSFNFGFHTGVINEPLELMRWFVGNITKERGKDVDEGFTTTIGSLCVTTFLLGGMIGGALGGMLMNRIGRKKSILVLSIPNILGCILMMICKVAKSYELIIIGRFISGLACGSYTGIGPTYLSEIAPLTIRGGAGTSHELIVVSAIVVSQILGLKFIMGTERLWPYLLGLSVVPCLGSLLLLRWCPESPRYLYIMKRDVDSARKVLLSIRSKEEEVTEELDIMRKEAECSVNKTSLKTILRTPHLRLLFWVAMVAQMGNQLTGQNGLVYYSVDLFKNCGIEGDNAIYSTIGLGLLFVLATFISAVMVDRLGRRVLFIGGLLAIAIGLVTFTAAMIGKDLGGVQWLAYIAVALTFVVSTAYSLGCGSIPCFLVPEMFTQENRDAVISVAALVNWTCNLVVGLSFPQLALYIVDYSFLPFVAITIFMTVYLWIYMPETKGRSPQSVEEEFKRRVGRRGGTETQFKEQEGNVDNTSFASLISNGDTTMTSENEADIGEGGGR